MLKLGYCDTILKKDQIDYCSNCFLYNKCKLSMFCSKCGTKKEKDISYCIMFKCKVCNETHIYDRDCKEFF